jgi:N-acetylneuraminic acid mutarotase
MSQLTRRIRFSSLLITMLVAILLTELRAPVQANSPAAPPGSDLTLGAPAGAVSPDRLLDPDGTLDMSTGFEGTLDLRGWDVFLDPQRGPLLEPASQVTDWNALPNQGLQGVNDRVSALAAVGSDLYVGGLFGETGDGSLTNLGSIARYDTLAGTWHALPNQGLGGTVSAMALDGSDLYVGGAFGQTGDGSLTSLGNIVRYDTVAGTWHALPNQGFDNTVLALVISGSDLYAGGYLRQTDDESLTGLGCVARYDTVAGTWHALSNQGLGGGSPPVPGYPPTPRVYAMAVSDGDLYVGGDFDYTGDGSVTNLGHVARYDTTTGTWHALPNQGLRGPVSAMALDGSDLYVGGSFTRTDDGTLTGLGRIARYDITAGTWHALPNQGLNDDVRALAVSGSDLYVGGEFTQTDDGTLTSLGRIARYDTTAGTWNALPNQGLNDEVRALAVSGSDLYVGGEFTQTGDGSLTNLGNIVRGSSAAPEPEIQVLDGTTDIPDGTGSVNFGATTVGMPINKTFTVKNAGTASLSLTEPVAVPAGFSVASSFGSTTLAPGNSTNFTVRLDAIAVGTYSGTLQFANNDADENPFDFTINGDVYYSVCLPLVIRQ